MVGHTLADARVEKLLRGYGQALEAPAATNTFLMHNIMNDFYIQVDSMKELNLIVSSAATMLMQYKIFICMLPVFNMKVTFGNKSEPRTVMVILFFCLEYSLTIIKLNVGGNAGVDAISSGIL